MKESYLKHYKKIGALFPLYLSWAALMERSSLRRLALINRQKDYAALTQTPKLHALHYEINRHLLAAADEWPHYDYGEGYFYQGLDSIGVRGFRDTRARMNVINLADAVDGKRVLDIGCNCGFVALCLAESAAAVTGMDVNPHLLRIGEAAAHHLGVNNVDLIPETFENWESPETFDVVCSFANHSTYDEQTKQGIDDYFQKCHSLLKQGGLFLFESHAPDFEGDKLIEVLNILQRFFMVKEKNVLEYGTFLDTGRTFVRAVKSTPT